MKLDRNTTTPMISVIEGGQGRALTVPEPATPQFSGAELAAEMAEMFALSLLQDCPLTHCADAHQTVRIDAATSFTLNELLCELRNLPWCDAEQDVDAKALAFSRANQEGSGHRRRALRWNGDGQLTLQTLFRGGVHGAKGAARQSRFWAAGDGQTTPDTLGEMAQRMSQGASTQPFFHAFSEFCDAGIEFDQGLNKTPDTAAWLNAMMSEARGRARRISLSRMARKDRLSRPVVTAARMSVALSSSEEHAPSEGDTLHSACENLADAAPNLVAWFSRANRAKRGPQRVPVSLFLPLQPIDAMPPHPSDLATHAVVAGALGTLIKAVFASEHGTLRPVGRDARPVANVGAEIDLLCAQISLARTVSGCFYPAESAQDLRIGETLALHLLRASLEDSNRSATLSWQGFDGQILRLEAHPRSFGRGYVEFKRDGFAIPWPEGEDRAAHLTEVV